MSPGTENQRGGCEFHVPKIRNCFGEVEARGSLIPGQLEYSGCRYCRLYGIIHETPLWVCL